MHPPPDPVNALRSSGRRAAVATLVAATGGAVRRLGSRMWVDDRGAIIGSVTIGGCVDARAVEAAEEVLRTGASRRISLPLGDEDAWAFGMTCAGSVEFIVERVDPALADDPVTTARNAVYDALSAGRVVAEISLVGDRPRRLVVSDDGAAYGTLGSEALDRQATARALALIGRGASEMFTVGTEDGISELFAQVHAPPATLVIVGATDVAAMLVRLAGPVGFRTIVIDGRERWANPERFPTADEIRVGMPSEVVGTLPLGPTAALVLLSHDYKYDLPVLELALGSRAGYIGVLGSLRRGQAIREFLVGNGVPVAELGRLHIPVGLDIGSRTPAEIAVSIVAEIVAVRAGRNLHVTPASAPPDVRSGVEASCRR